MNWIKDKIKKFGDSLKKYTRKRPSRNEQENADWINCPSCKKLQYKKNIRYLLWSKLLNRLAIHR